MQILNAQAIGYVGTIGASWLTNRGISELVRRNDPDNIAAQTNRIVPFVRTSISVILSCAISLIFRRVIGQPLKFKATFALTLVSTLFFKFIELQLLKPKIESQSLEQSLKK